MYARAIDHAEADAALAVTHDIVLPSVSEIKSALQTSSFRGSFSWPTLSPTDASPHPSRDVSARFGADAVRFTFNAEDFHLLLLAGLPALHE